jgi:hypothetical protein
LNDFSSNPNLGFWFTIETSGGSNMFSLQTSIFHFYYYSLGLELNFIVCLFRLVTNDRIDDVRSISKHIRMPNAKRQLLVRSHLLIIMIVVVVVVVVVVIVVVVVVIVVVEVGYLFNLARRPRATSSSARVSEKIVYESEVTTTKTNSWRNNNVCFA